MGGTNAHETENTEPKPETNTSNTPTGIQKASTARRQSRTVPAGTKGESPPTPPQGNQTTKHRPTERRPAKHETHTRQHNNDAPRFRMEAGRHPGGRNPQKADQKPKRKGSTNGKAFICTPVLPPNRNWKVKAHNTTEGNYSSRWRRPRNMY